MFIGIGGVSRAGKTTLARLLSEGLGKNGINVITVHQDEHVIPEEELPLIRDKRDWELPRSIDWSSLYATVKHSLDIADCVILDGLFCYSDRRLNELMNIKMFVNIDKDLFVRRKQEDLRWGSKPEPDWYIEHIWDSYIKHGQPQEVEIDYRLDGTVYFDIDKLVLSIMK